MEKLTLNCGWGQKEITPQRKTMLRGQFYTRIAEKAHDPLYATAKAICPENGEPVFWVSLDLVAIDRVTTEIIADEIQKKIPGFTRDRLICSCIHNHTGPFLRSDSSVREWGESFRIVTPGDCIVPEEYAKDFFAPRVAEACFDAYNNLKPSGFSSVLGHAVIGHCRRIKYRDGSSVMYGNTDDYNFDSYEGPTDNGIEMLYIYDENDILSGLVINVNCPAQVVEHKSEYSADFIGAFRQLLWKKLGYKLPVLALIGTAGNISPRDLVRRNRGEPSMNDYEGAEEIGRRLLNCFEYNLDKAGSNIEKKLEFGHEFKILPLPIRTVSLKESAEAENEYNKFLNKYNGDPSKFSQEDKYNSSWFAGIVNRGKLQKQCTLYDAPLHSLRIGNSAFVTNPFELYIEYGLRMRARAKAIHTFTVQLTDDSAGYLPTPFAVSAKSYSAMVSNCLVSCEGAELLTETLIRMVNALYK
jgi:hypothetical protein